MGSGKIDKAKKKRKKKKRERRKRDNSREADGERKEDFVKMSKMSD